MGKDVELTDVNPYTRLNVTQRRYVEARLQGLTVQAAGKAAGLTCAQSASRMERMPSIRSAIKWIVKESTRSVTELSKDDVISGMMDAVDAAATATELVAAWRELGKLIGAYEPERRVLEIRDYTQDELRTLSDDELARLAGGRMKDAIDAEFYEVE